MKKVLSLWKTVILVISALIGVAGVTILSLYLMGQLGEEKVEPQDILFENVLTEGDGFYNEGLSQFEVASDFKLTVSTTTENVTENSVTLSLIGGTTEADEDGFITDGVVKVKKYVELNKPFDVYLQPTYNQNLETSWIMGGQSLLTATSSNVLIEPQTIKIAVDCLVDEINLKVTGKDSFVQTQSVMVGETFSIQTVFSPEASGYLYSDSSRNKEIFYDMSKLYISHDPETGKFTANTRSGNDFDTIRVYTFANSYYQQDILGKFSSITNREDLTSAVLRYFGEHPETCVSKSINIKVADVDVESVAMDANEKTFDISFDKYYTITAKSAAADNTLGLSIKDSKANQLNNLFAKVGIKLPVESTDFSKLSFVGGKIAKVSKFANGKVEIQTVDHVDQMQFPVEDADLEIEKISYYLLPNTAPKYASDYYWKFWVSSNDNADVNFDLKVNFFYENEDNQMVSFFDIENAGTNDELSFRLALSAQNQGIEEKVGWRNEAGISMVINFEEDGTPISANYDLSKEITAIPSTTLYQTVKYFMFLSNDSAITSEQIQNYFACSTGKYYTKDYQGVKDLTIKRFDMPANGYELFELDGSILTAKKSLQGKVYVVAATIKTYADGTPYIDADGKYLIVKISNAREVYVSSSLSIANMLPTFEFEDENDRVYQDDETGEYFVPSVVKNNGDELNLIKFKLTLNNCENFDTEDSTSEIAKVLRAFNTPSEDLKLYIECDETTKQYVSLKNVVFSEELSDEARKIAVFEASLEINKDELETSTVKDMFGSLVKLNLVFEDGANTFKKAIVKEDDASTSFRIYNQQVCAITGSYEPGLESETVIVNVASTGVEISWGANAWQDDANGTAISKLGEKLIFEMTDQFGQPIYSEDGVYKIKFEETSGSVNKVLSFGADLDKVQNFNATHGATIQTELTVFVVEKSSGQEIKVGKFGADGIVERDDQGNVIPLSSPTFAFSVKSEGVAEVWYNSYNGESVDTEEEKTVWAKSDSTSAIEISRYVVAGDIFNLPESVKIFTNKIDENDTMTDAEELEKVKTAQSVATEFYFDPTFLSGLSDKGVGLRKMFSKINLATGEAEPVDNTTLEAYRGKKISSVEFAYPFVDNDEDGIQIEFKATGVNGSLFDISITFKCIADLSISTSAFDAYEETYKDYLIKDGNKISVFADQEFALDTYAKLSSATGKMGGDDQYSWAKLTGIDYYELSSTEIASIENGVLKIGKVYDYTTLILTLYYGPKTKYACSTTIRLYINPNILIKQTKTNSIDLATIEDGNVSITNCYEFYKVVGDNAYLKADGSINTETSEDKMPKVLNILPNLSYTNESTTKYIQITENTGIVKFANAENTIDFKLGQSYNQSFTLTYSDGSIVKPQVKAVKLCEDGQIELNDKGVRLDFELVYAEDGQIFVESNNSTNPIEIDTVVYGGTEYLLFLADSNYYISAEYTVTNYSGLIRKSGDHGLIVDSISQGYFSVEGNMFELSQTFKNSDGTSSGTLTATILFRAIVSGFGDKFVYYNNSAFDANKIVYNSFVYENEDNADLKEILEISNTNIYQTLDAGEYIVVHDTYLNREYITKGSQYYLTKEDAEKEMNSKTAQKDIYFGNFIAKANIYTKDQIVEIKVNENTTYYIKYNEGILGFGKDIKSYQNILGFYFDGKASGVSDAPNDTSVRVTIDIAAQGYVDGLATLSKVDSLDNYDSVLKINNVSKEYVEKYGDVFVTLKFEIYKTAYPSQKFVMYYRIKVNPSYTLAEVTYPYSDNEEYLTETHADFKDGQYSINLEEEFNEANSGEHSEGKRFADAYSIVESGEPEKISANASYQITSVKLGGNDIAKETYFDMLEVSGEGIFTAKLNAMGLGADIEVVVTKTLSLDDQEMIGSAREYTFKFNQGSVYEHSLSATINNETDSTLTKSDDDAYTQSITAGCGEIIYTADIKIKGSNNSYTNVSDYTAYVKMLTEKCGLSDALMPVAVTYDADGKASYSFENAKYTYSVSEGTIGYYDSDKTTTSEIEVVSNVAEEISGEGFTGYTLAYGETYYFKNSDLTKTGSDGNWTYKVAAGKAIYLRYVASEDLPYSFTPALDLSNEYAQVDIKIQDKTVTAYIKSSDVMETTKYYYLDDSNKLHFKPLDSISQDMQLEIGYYTSERVVFKVIVDLKSYFVHELNDIDFIGGKEYSVSGDIFKELKSSKDDISISSFKLELTNGDDTYINDVKISDLVNLGDLADGVKNLSSSITFAHLPQDAIFKFTATINNEYSFDFELLVKASVDSSATRISDKTTEKHYANETFSVAISNIKADFGFEQTEEKYESSENGIKTGFVFAENQTQQKEITYLEYSNTTIYPREQLEIAYKFNDKQIFTFFVEYRYQIAPSVDVEACHPTPDGTNEISAEYISTELKDGVYSSEVFADFFNSPAQHSTESRRIDIEDKTINTEKPEGQLKDIGTNWTILVSQISNVKLQVVGQDLNINKTITSAGADRTILQDLKVPSEESSGYPNIELTFEIENSQSEGLVSFLVTINGDSTEYNVVVCLGSAYTVSHSSPNYANNQEIIYAEDLASQELNIFAQDRIASFITKDSSAIGTYYLRFVNKDNQSEVATPKITISEHTSSITNIDLGRSFKDYNYEGTFSTKDLAKTGLVENKLDSKLYANGMNITNRIVVSYGGTELKLDQEQSENSYTLQLKQRLTTDDNGNYTYKNFGTEGNENYNSLANDFNVSEGDYAKQVTVEAVLVYGTYDAENNKGTNLNSIYSYYLDLELEVNGAANDISGYETHILQANGGLSGGAQTPYQLMNVVDIFNKRTNSAYGTTGLANSAGTIDLQIYGFDTLTVTQDKLTEDAIKNYLKGDSTEVEKLQAIAGYFHNMLINSEVEIAGRGSIKYKTGLIPTHKLTQINGSGSGFTSFDNYISIAGAETGKTTDYKLFANAANNDGNHVMMRLKYSVDINGSTEGGEVEKYFNLLFKVEPNSDILFATGYDSSTYLPGAEETDNQQTIISNYQQVYLIEQESLTAEDINLFLVSNQANKSPVWKALMYDNDSLNSANNFKYTITINKSIGSVTYNDLDKFKNWLVGEGAAWWNGESVYTSKDLNKSTSSEEDDIIDLQVQVPSINLGSRDYMIEIENAFGFRARFYFRYVSKINPQILSMTSYNIEENTNLAFMANYNEATGSYYGSTGEHQLSSFMYVEKEYDLQGGTKQKYYNNTIKVENNTDNTLTIKAYTEDITWSDLTIKFYKELGTVSSDNTAYLKIWDKVVEDEKGKQEEIDNGGWTAVAGADWKGTLHQKYGEDGSVGNDNYDFYLTGKNIIITVTAANGSTGHGFYSVSNPGYMSRWRINDNSTPDDTSDDKQEELFITSINDQNIATEKVGITDGETYYVLKEEEKSLTETYTVSQEGSTPRITPGSADNVTTEVSLSGLTAIGFDKDEAKLIDKTALEAKDSNLISNVNDIFVDSVDFYYNDEWLGGSWAQQGNYGKNQDGVLKGEDDNNTWTDKAVSGEEDGNGVIDNTEEELTHKIAPIITSDEMYFASKANNNDIKIEQGQGGTFDSKNGKPYVFKVPYISGIKFGTGSSLSNVTMNVTLRDINNNTTTISKVVSINRRATTSGNFANNNIQDGTGPVANNSLNDTGAAILNDTLEVTLKAKTSVTFMVHNNEISNISTDLLTATVGSGEAATTFAPKLITLTNSNAYQVTKYVGISASIVGLEENLKSGSGFYVYVLENDQDNPATFAYNGSKFSTDINAEKTGWTRTDDKGTVDTTDDVTYTIKGYNSTIGTYGSANALKLRFSTVDEVLSSNSKTEKLFFLYSAYGETYQFVENFNVYPLYTSAETSNGTNKIIVDDYMIATKGGETYYMVSLSSWAKDILLYNYSVGIDSKEGTKGSFVGGKIGDYENTTKVPAYKFYFKINDDMGGSAFIDENGLITTNTTYNIKDHQMAVDVYMKVSGPEGNFEDINQKLLIGTFIINLNPASSNVNSIRFAKENKTDGYGQYNNDLISLASNTTLTGSSSDTISNISDSDSKSFTFSTPVGESLNLKNLLDNVTHDASSWTNKNYHIVKDGTEYLYYNNLNSWTFSEIGTHTIEVVVSGRASSEDGISYKALTNIQVVVYDNKINEENIFDCPVPATTTNGTTTYAVYTHTLDSGYTWYLRNDDGSVEALTSKTIDVNKDENEKTYTGIIQKKYIAVASDGTVKNVVYTYYVYGKVDEKSVALTNTSTLKFESLIDNQEDGWTYTFYDENYEEITQESYNSYGQNSTLSKTIYMQAYNDETKEQSLTKIKLTIKVINSDVTQRIVEFKNGELTNEIVEAEFKNALSSKLSDNMLVSNEVFLEKTLNQDTQKEEYTNTKNVWTYEILDGKVLKDKDTKATKDGKVYDLSYLDEKNNQQYYTTFLVSCRAAGSQSNEYFRFVFTYCIYQGEYHITTEVKANNNYALTNLNDMVKDKICENCKSDIDDKITLCDNHNSSAVRYFAIEGEKMVEKTFVDVENSHYQVYYVLINGNYYKFNIALFGRVTELTVSGFAYVTVECAIKEYLDATSVEIYKADADTDRLVKINLEDEISTTIYAKVGDTYYAFNLNQTTNE